MKKLFAVAIAWALLSAPALADSITTPAVLGARATSSPGNPSATSSATAVMMGLAGTFTPKATGNFLFITSFTAFNNTASDGCIFQLRFGTGAAPANAAAVTGTQSGNTMTFVNNANTALIQSPSELIGYSTGLTIGTAAWYDIAVNTVTGGTCTITNVTLIAIEL